jgi:DNA-binding response OmpR family regulator
MRAQDREDAVHVRVAGTRHSIVISASSGAVSQHSERWLSHNSPTMADVQYQDSYRSIAGAVPERIQVLVVEDDPRMQKVLLRALIAEGIEVIASCDGVDALERFREMRPGAVVLDLNLPRLSGRDVCREIKAQSPDTPVLILSARSEVVDKVLLFEIGADDYITKPFSPRELLARLQAALRRSQRRRATPEAPEQHTFGRCTVHFGQMTAERGGEQIPLTTLEFKLLRHLIEHSGTVLSRESLLTQVWGYNAYPTTRTVDNQILKLRQKLEEDPANPRHLLTVYGSGYRFVA